MAAELKKNYLFNFDGMLVRVVRSDTPLQKEVNIKEVVGRGINPETAIPLGLWEIFDEDEDDMMQSCD
jgi:hypothetical protein